LSSEGILQTRGILQLWTSALFGAKNIGVFEIYCVSVRTREKRAELVQTRGGQFFAILCGRTLWTKLDIHNAIVKCNRIWGSILVHADIF